MYSVMIVEDELLTRMTLCNAVDWKKFNMTVVKEAANGQEAWEACQELKPQLVVTDIRMPDMSGMELI